MIGLVLTSFFVLLAKKSSICSRKQWLRRMILTSFNSFNNFNKIPIENHNNLSPEVYKLANEIIDT